MRMVFPFPVAPEIGRFAAPKAEFSYASPAVEAIQSPTFWRDFDLGKPADTRHWESAISQPSAPSNDREKPHHGKVGGAKRRPPRTGFD
jgi:hypothetical protein